MFHISSPLPSWHNTFYSGKLYLSFSVPILFCRHLHKFFPANLNRNTKPHFILARSSSVGTPQLAAPTRHKSRSLNCSTSLEPQQPYVSKLICVAAERIGRQMQEEAIHSRRWCVACYSPHEVSSPLLIINIFFHNFSFIFAFVDIYVDWN